MGRFHIVHGIPDANVHQFQGFAEVIDTLVWGLSELGHEVTRAINEPRLDARNIMLGNHMMPIEWQQKMPANSILYSLEQVRGARSLRSEFRYAVETFQLWEYSTFNLDYWERHGTRYPVVHVPVGYAPVLEKMPRPAVQDIDVLIYGTANELRLELYEALAELGLVSMFVTGLYGQARDEIIGRSKVIANQSYFTKSSIFEIVRASYLLANRKATVACLTEVHGVEPDIMPAIAGVPPERMLDTVQRLVDDAATRGELEQRGYDIIKAWDIRPILERALAATPDL